MRQSQGEENKNYQEINNENDQKHINSAPSYQRQVHRRTPVFVGVNNDKKKNLLTK